MDTQAVRVIQHDHRVVALRERDDLVQWGNTAVYAEYPFGHNEAAARVPRRLQDCRQIGCVSMTVASQRCGGTTYTRGQCTVGEVVGKDGVSIVDQRPEEPATLEKLRGKKMLFSIPRKSADVRLSTSSIFPMVLPTCVCPSPVPHSCSSRTILSSMARLPWRPR